MSALADEIRAAVAAELVRLLPAIDERVARIEARLPPALGGIDDAARVTGMSRSSVKRALKTGDIQSTKVGRRVLIDLASLRPLSREKVIELAAKARGR